MEAAWLPQSWVQHLLGDMLCCSEHCSHAHGQETQILQVIKTMFLLSRLSIKIFCRLLELMFYLLTGLFCLTSVALFVKSNFVVHIDNFDYSVNWAIFSIKVQTNHFLHCPQLNLSIIQTFSLKCETFKIIVLEGKYLLLPTLSTTPSLQLQRWSVMMMMPSHRK